jgi:hypothetical protein
MKKLLIALMMIFLISIPVSAEIIVQAGTEITDDLDIVDVEKSTYQYGEEVYVMAYSNKPFGQKYLEITLINTSGLGEKILGRRDMEIDPDWDTAGLPVTPEPGEYKIKFSTYDESGFVELIIVQ